MWSACYCCLIVTKISICSDILSKLINTQFETNSLAVPWLITCWQTDASFIIGRLCQLLTPEATEWDVNCHRGSRTRLSFQHKAWTEAAKPEIYFSAENMCSLLLPTRGMDYTQRRLTQTILTDHLHLAQSFRSRQSLTYSRISQNFFEPEGSLPHSQKLSIGPYPKSDQFSPYRSLPPRSIFTLFFHLHLDLPSGLFLLAFPPKILFSTYMLHALPISSSFIWSF
jgi:hypothetical protein